MKFSIRRLASGDESILGMLASEDTNFDVAGRGDALEPLSAEAASAFLGDPSVLFWVAEENGVVAGFLFCSVLKLRAAVKREVLLYEIGVRSQYRRLGVGRALQKTLDTWMAENDVPQVWVLADNPEAVEFYKSCGFNIEEGMAVYMTKTIAGD